MSTPLAAILLSRQAARPNGVTPWVRQVLHAVLAARAAGARLLTSVGMQSWELVAVAAAIENVPQVLHLPESERGNTDLWTCTLGLDPSRDQIRCIDCGSPGPRVKRFMTERDRLIVESADIIYPISLRPHGTMAALITDARSSGRLVIDDFIIPYDSHSTPLKYDVCPEHLNPELNNVGNRFLIHWTRSANQAWPDERLFDYYRDVMESDTYPRSALDTLLHILSTRTLKASARHMPGNIPTVSLTGLTPVASLPLMRWRARYGEMSFEPYGVGIAHECAAALGILPVRYYDAKTTRRPDDIELWRTQSIGIRTDWRQEQEYRAPGPLDLSRVPPDSLVAFCCSETEAKKITALTGVRAVAMFSD